MRRLEVEYLLPVLRSQRLSGKSGERSAAADISALGISNGDAAIRIETKVVDLNVRIIPKLAQSLVATTLSKEDFAVIEDGVPQEITFFSTAEAPFDLVLVLDFSGSTSDKQGLIKKAAKRFV